MPRLISPPSDIMSLLAKGMVVVLGDLDLIVVDVGTMRGFGILDKYCLY
jgi:hypothetical protein